MSVVTRPPPSSLSKKPVAQKALKLVHNNNKIRKQLKKGIQDKRMFIHLMENHECHKLSLTGIHKIVVKKLYFTSLHWINQARPG